MSEEKATYLELKAYVLGVVEDAIEEYGDNWEMVREYIQESIDNTNHVVYYSRAWNTVSTVRESDNDLFDRGHDYLIDMGCAQIDDDETIDSLICRLAYAILMVMAEDEVESIRADALHEKSH